jgi:hypothetical protein
VRLDGLPDDAYLAWRYVDGHGGIDRAQIYWDDGRVEALEGEAVELLCTFDADQVEAARRAVNESGLPDAIDRPRGDTHDAAAITYWWRLGDRVGTLVNAAFPAEQPPEIDRLEARLAELEEAAGGWPLSADE